MRSHKPPQFAVEVICRECSLHLSGPVAAGYVRWGLCDDCAGTATTVPYEPSWGRKVFMFVFCGTDRQLYRDWLELCRLRRVKLR